MLLALTGSIVLASIQDCSNGATLSHGMTRPVLFGRASRGEARFEEGGEGGKVAAAVDKCRAANSLGTRGLLDY
jgi:hypothetical protein